MKIFDDKLISCFEWFRKRPEDVASTPPIYMAFDCLYLEGRDLRRTMCLPQSGGWDPHGGQQVPAQKQGRSLGIDPVILEPGGGDGFRLLGVRQDGVVPQAFDQIHEPPPRPRRLNGDARSPREFREKLLQSRRLAASSRWMSSLSQSSPRNPPLTAILASERRINVDLSSRNPA